MVETISPVGYGGRTGRWLAAVALHTLGATVTAAAFGAALGAVGSVLHAPWGAARARRLAAAALAYAARERVRSAAAGPRCAPAGPGLVALLLLLAGCRDALRRRPGDRLPHVPHERRARGGRVRRRGSRAGPPRAPWWWGAFGLARGLSALAARPVRTREAGAALVDRLAARDPAWWRRVNAAALLLVGAAVLLRLARIDPPARSGPRSRPRPPSVSGDRVRMVRGREAGHAGGVAPDAGRAGPAARPTRVAAAAVPAVEAAVPAAVILGAPAAAAAIALVSLVGFSVAIVRTRVRDGRDAVACGCFGGSRSRDYRLLLARNAALAAAAVAGLAASRGPRRLVARRAGAGRALPVAVATSAVAVAVLTAWRSASWLGRGRRA